MPGTPNGFTQRLAILALSTLATVLIGVLVYTFNVLASEQSGTADKAAANELELARREAPIARIPVIESTVRRIELEQVSQGKVLEAIAQKVGAR